MRTEFRLVAIAEEWHVLILLDKFKLEHDEDPLSPTEFNSVIAYVQENDLIGRALRRLGVTGAFWHAVAIQWTTKDAYFDTPWTERGGSRAISRGGTGPSAWHGYENTLILNHLNVRHKPRPLSPLNVGFEGWRFGAEEGGITCDESRLSEIYSWIRRVDLCRADDNRLGAEIVPEFRFVSGPQWFTASARAGLAQALFVWHFTRSGLVWVGGGSHEKFEPAEFGSDAYFDGEPLHDRLCSSPCVYAYGYEFRRFENPSRYLSDPSILPILYVETDTPKVDWSGRPTGFTPAWQSRLSRIARQAKTLKRVPVFYHLQGYAGRQPLPPVADQFVSVADPACSSDDGETWKVRCLAAPR